MKSPDVVIVGAGVIGCAIARDLADSGVGSLLIDPDPLGANASWAAAGMLAPLTEADEATAFLDLLRASARLFPALSAELLERTGIDVQHRTEGTLLVALTERDEEEIGARFHWQSRADLPVQRLDGDRARDLEPLLSQNVRCALRFPEDHQVDGRLLARALARAATQQGATLRRGRVRAIAREGRRATGVQMEDGEMIRADAVVIAAGCWSGRLGGLPRDLPVRPVHGQLLALRTEPGAMTHVVDSPRVYLVPRRDGRVIVGATTEETGFRTSVSPAATVRLRASAAEAVPALGAAELVDSWSGLRPGTPDQLPIVGADPEVTGLFYATGHYRNGILLAPLTGRVIRDVVVGTPPEVDLAPFSIGRFG